MYLVRPSLPLLTMCCVSVHVAMLALDVILHQARLAELDGWVQLGWGATSPEFMGSPIPVQPDLRVHLAASQCGSPESQGGMPLSGQAACRTRCKQQTVMAKHTSKVWPEIQRSRFQDCFRQVIKQNFWFRRRHHRKRGVSNKEQPLSDLIGAPLVLYLPEEEAAGLQLKKHLLDQWASQVWVQQPNVLDEALLTALRCHLATDCKPGTPRLTSPAANTLHDQTIVTFLLRESH